MKEIALHLLDIAQNSVSAGATKLELSLVERDGVLTMTVTDNGKGMTAEFLAQVMDPFTTTRTTRKVGMGIPLLQLSAQLAGGGVSIESTPGVGTTVRATFLQSDIDCLPLGDLPGTLCVFLQGAPEQLHTVYLHETERGSFRLDTQELRDILGPVPLSTPDVALWLRDYLQEQEAALI